MRTTLGCVALVAAVLVSPQRGVGCTIPVYRYALERWDLATYDVLVFHRGAVPAEVRRCKETSPANLEITAADLDGKLSPELQQIWKQQPADATLPWLVVRVPGTAVERPAAWAGPCSGDALAAVVDSPARRQIVAALGRGETAVFVLLSGGDPGADEAAARLVGEELGRLEKGLKLPEQSKDGPQLRLPLPLQVRFTLLPLRRDDPREQAFIRLLLATEEGLEKVEGPILFPVFGRGRSLGCLYGKDLNAGEVFEVAQFLCKECSCQLKELNPGTDLLIQADWPAHFERLLQEAPPVPAVAAAPAPVVTAASDEPADVPPPSRDWRWLLGGAIASLVVMACAWGARPTWR